MSNQARRKLNSMRGSLKKWLKFRRTNDEVASGQRAAKVPAHYAAQRLPSIRAHERNLATDLHTLLSEVTDPRGLPLPSHPGSVVALAEIVVAGKLPEEVSSVSDVGLIWLWPMAIVAGVGGLVIMTKIESDADVAMEKERMECIRSGACTDYGFWIKIAAIAGLGWFAWEKLGVKERVKRLRA